MEFDPEKLVQDYQRVQVENHNLIEDNSALKKRIDLLNKELRSAKLRIVELNSDACIYERTTLRQILAMLVVKLGGKVRISHLDFINLDPRFRLTFSENTNEAATYIQVYIPSRNA